MWLFLERSYVITCFPATVIVLSLVVLPDKIEFPEPSVLGICIYKTCGAQFEQEVVLFLASRAIWLQAEYSLEYAI